MAYETSTSAPTQSPEAAQIDGQELLPFDAGAEEVSPLFTRSLGRVVAQGARILPPSGDPNGSYNAFDSAIA